LKELTNKIVKQKDFRKILKQKEDDQFTRELIDQINKLRKMRAVG